ncbi:hypothetical protein, partial [Chromobacterium piscinae]|uniref:hypothetical protein n=1 Tax=Chromobacterium piscinae TaxID=686831 RepID=UPI0032615F98
GYLAKQISPPCPPGSPGNQNHHPRSGFKTSQIVNKHLDVQHSPTARPLRRAVLFRPSPVLHNIE